jgi:uncharacterized protein YjbI with pentapeptide repeats
VRLFKDERITVAPDECAGATFEDCDLTDADFFEADLVGTSFVRCKGERPRFDRADLTDASFTDCDFTNARFVDVDVGGASWKGCKLLGSTLQKFEGLGWELERCTIMLGDMKHMSFKGMTLREVDFSEADLTGADFTAATLERCRLIRSDCTDACFAGADLRGADLGPIDGAKLMALKGAVVSEHQAIGIAEAFGLTVDRQEPD